MSRSISFPFRPSGRGGLPLTDETDVGGPLRQAIVISLIGGDTRHPWDRAAELVAPGGIYRTDREPDSARTIDKRFDGLRRQGRARLVDRPRVVSANGRKTVAFEYVNLETGETVPFGPRA